MNRIFWNTGGQAMSSSVQTYPGKYEEQTSESNQQTSELTAWKAEGRSSDDSYQTADDDEQHVLPGLDNALAHDANQQQESCSEFESSDEDDSLRLSDRHSKEMEQRRPSYQFAIAKSGHLMLDAKDDDNVVCDLDPVEFQHQHLQTSDACCEDSDSHSEDLPCDLDPREFTHASMNVNNASEGRKSGSDKEKQFHNEDESLLQPSSLHSEGCNRMCMTERQESIIQGNVLRTITILCPAEKIFITERQEWIVRQSSRRAVFDFSLAWELLLPFAPAGDVDTRTSQLSTSNLYREYLSDEEQVPSRFSDARQNEEPLQIVEAVVSETTELIRAKLIETAASWDSFMYDEENFSSSPEKDGECRFEADVPSPDYDSSTSSSDTSSEADDDITADEDIHSDTPRADRSPTPDYDTLSPIFEQDMEFRFDASEHSKPQPAAEVNSDLAGKLTDGRSDEIKVGGDIKEYEDSAGQQLVFARKGSQRFGKPALGNVLTMEPEVTEQANEVEFAEYEQKHTDISDSFEPTRSVDLFTLQEQYGVVSAPVNVPPHEQGMLWQSQSKTQASPADQPTLYSTLGHSFDKRKRKRSVLISC